MTGPVRWWVARWRAARSALLGEVLGFAAAGLCAYASDLALFVWLRGQMGLGPLTAKTLSFLAACTVAYAGNALITYRERSGEKPTETIPKPTKTGPAPACARSPRLRRCALFFAVNLAGAVVQLLTLALTHYGLGLTSPRADTVSGAGIGMVLATVLRFWGTRTLVFRVVPN